MTRRIVGLCGYAQVGKDTAAAELAKSGWIRWAFADFLKADLSRLVRQHLNRDIWTVTGKTKEKLRPLMVAWGAVCRSFDPNFWVNRLFAELPQEGRFIISDVRYLNEVRAIQNAGGIVIYIARPGFGPANEEEERSIKELWAGDKSPFWGAVKNDSTPEAMGQAVLKIIAAAEDLGVFQEQEAAS